MKRHKESYKVHTELLLLSFLPIHCGMGISRVKVVFLTTHGQEQQKNLTYIRVTHTYIKSYTFKKD